MSKGRDVGEGGRGSYPKPNLLGNFVIETVFYDSVEWFYDFISKKYIFYLYSVFKDYI